MNLTLHLTENCNMDCDYCIREKRPRDMTEEVVDAACNMIFSTGKRAGLTFFGGEPLLKKNLIYRALSRCRELSKDTGKPFFCKMTTNGSLLDEEFLQKAAEFNMGIGLSFDGKAQDLCRHLKGGGDTLEVVSDKAGLLLKYLPGSYAMMTISPLAAGTVFESVKYLYELGFRYINCTIAYGNRVEWTDEAMEVLQTEYGRVAELYMEHFTDNSFFFGPFDGKIRDALNGYNPADRCHLGTRQMPVAPDGGLYACTQFIGDEDYCLGNVFEGIDAAAQLRITKRKLELSENSECATCDLKNRCSHTCGCTNRLETGDENVVSAVTCNYEQSVIMLADSVADRLYKKYPEEFKKRFLA